MQTKKEEKKLQRKCLIGEVSFLLGVQIPPTAPYK
jgi:hypothetical protein